MAIRPSPNPRRTGRFRSALPQAHPEEERIEVTGKTDSIGFDHFGDFDGFTVEDDCVRHHHFRSRQDAMLELGSVSPGSSGTGSR